MSTRRRGDARGKKGTGVLAKIGGGKVMTETRRDFPWSEVTTKLGIPSNTFPLAAEVVADGSGGYVLSLTYNQSMPTKPGEAVVD